MFLNVNACSIMLGGFQGHDSTTGELVEAVEHNNCVLRMIRRDYHMYITHTYNLHV